MTFSVTIGQGPPALMIHCSLARHEVLLPLAGMLPNRTTLFDLPGHGRSPDWDGVTDYQKLTCAIAEDLAELGSHIIGHSFGATVALRLACTRPDLVTRLTLIEPVFFAAARGTSAFEANQRTFAPFYAALQAGNHIAAASEFLWQWQQAKWDALSQRAQVYISDRINLIQAVTPAIEQDNFGLLASGLIDKLTLPVDLIEGASSLPIVPAIHAEFVKRIPQARIVTIPNAGHMVPITHPQETFNAMHLPQMPPIADLP